MPYTSEEARTISGEILNQLGGNRFVAMTGAKQFGFATVENEVNFSFKIGRNAGKVTHVTVTLDPSDTYTMKLVKIRGVKMTTVAEQSGLYDDMIADFFSEVTGMNLTL